MPISRRRRRASLLISSALPVLLLALSARRLAERVVPPPAMAAAAVGETDGVITPTVFLPLIANPPAPPPEILNGDFEGGTWRETLDGRIYIEVEVPERWVAYWREDKDVPHDPDNHTGYVRPEMKVINRVEPYLDPPRIHTGDRALQYFKQWAIYDAGLYQSIPGIQPGERLQVSGWAHAWSANGTYDDTGRAASCSEGDDVGCEAFYALEGSDGLDDAERNFTFRLGIDPTGGTDPWAETVVWGDGAHIYNVYAEVPLLEVEAQSNTATVFLRSEVLWGFRNCDSYWDAIEFRVLEK